MKIIDSGHTYELRSYDGIQENILTFMKRYGCSYPGNENEYPGTNCQEVLRALIDRVKYLHNQIPHQRNILILDNLRQALYSFESRAAERRGRILGPEICVYAIEHYETCPKCGHIH